MKARTRVPAQNPEAREAQLINLAMRRAEEQLEAGTASSQVITHFLKLGTARAKIDLEEAQARAELARAKADSIRAQQTSEELYEKALQAFSSYGGDNIAITRDDLDEDYLEFD